MDRFHRILFAIILPAFTLLLGWQLGVRYEQRELLHLQQKLEVMYQGGAQAGSGVAVQDPQKEVDITLFWAVWRLLLQNYIHPEDLATQNLLNGAVEGLVKAVGDPYTVFMTPSDSKEFHDALSGHLQGIGAELAMRDDEIVIVSPLKGSPAEKAGLKPDDIIRSVDGESLAGKNLQDAVTRIRGPKGTTVTLLIERAGSPELITVRIVRDDIRVPSTEYEVKKTATGSIALLSINQFGAETMDEVREYLQQTAKDKALKGLIVDLRFNGGGYLEGAIELGSMFLKEGKIVSVERRDGEPQRQYASGRPILPEIPMVVLINEGSASASEIVAGALQDHKRATIVGKKSFGKGTVQEVIELPGGGSLRVTIAKWLTPNGKDLSKEGVAPDIEVNRTQEDFDAQRDPQLDTALEWLLDKQDISGQFTTASGTTVKGDQE